MGEAELQQQLFNHLKSVFPTHLSLVDELCDLLDLSADSVYRRIRGEKPLSLSELKTICEKYRLSLDQMLQLGTETVLFEAPGLNMPHGTITQYMQAAARQVNFFSSFMKKEIFCLCKDVPLWYYFLFPELAAFKCFFWARTIRNEEQLLDKKFSLEEYRYDECFALGQQILAEYNQMLTVEIWNSESVNSTLNQILYYRDAGLFKRTADFDVVLESFVKTIDHLQVQAEKGVKFLPGASQLAHKAPHQFYVNELILGTNTLIWKLDNKTFTLLVFNVLSYLITSDPRFAQKTQDSFHTLLARSALISGTGERERNRFFNRWRDYIHTTTK